MAERSSPEPGSPTGSESSGGLQLVGVDGRSSGSTAGTADSERGAGTRTERSREASNASSEPPVRGGAGPNADRSGRSVDRSRRWVVPIWLLLLVVVIFAVALVWQVRVAGELESQIERLEAQLADSRARVAAQRRHLGEVREGVHGLAEQVEALRALVDLEPGAASDAGPVAEGRSGPGLSDPGAPPPAPIPARLPQR